jgi:hypothetical protein
MSRDRDVYLHDLVEAADRVGNYLGGVGREQFMSTPPPARPPAPLPGCARTRAG